MKYKVLQTTVYSRLLKTLALASRAASRFNRVWSAVMLSCLLVSAFEVGGASTAKAQQINPQLRQDFLANPLEESPRDPLLPPLGVEREYSPLEEQAIEERLDELNQRALQLLEQGQNDEAFELWIRELKLRRVLGTTAEFGAIQRVAGFAWGQQRPVEVQLLTLRTREIWQAIQMSLGVSSADTDFAPSAMRPRPADSLVSGAMTSDIATLTALAETFETLRDIYSAIAVYSQLID
ncbi:MAG: hypothetical protein AAFU53_14700, partial [Cyanobacteria bacterium J06632_3]